MMLYVYVRVVDSKNAPFQVGDYVAAGFRRRTDYFFENVDLWTDTLFQLKILHSSTS